MKNKTSINRKTKALNKAIVSNCFSCGGNTYEKLDGRIEVGDLYYFAFTDRVEQYKDVDYGPFEPNDMGCVKVSLKNCC